MDIGQIPIAEPTRVKQVNNDRIYNTIIKYDRFITIVSRLGSTS